VSQSVFFRLQISEFVRVEKLCQRDAQAVAYHFDRDDPRIVAYTIDDILDAGWGHSRLIRKGVDGHVMVIA